MRAKLTSIEAKDFIHSEDKKYLAKMDSVPGLKQFIAETISNLREKITSIEMYGEGLIVSENSYKDLYALLQEASGILDYENIPNFALSWSYDISMGTEGFKKPRITALSGAIDLLEEDELLFLLGHELGHIMAGHKPYQNLLITFYTPLLNVVPNAQLWLGMLRPMLLQWYRISDFTADRAGLLVCQDINVALKTMIKMSGIPQKYYDSINTESILKQAVLFERQNKDFANNIIQNLSINTACAPWMVVRAAQLYNWYMSGEYTSIINKYAI
jgi:Zn-dependent protease with chaperone function